ncbi:hypothetical protein FLA_0902 [Filimonas lacunae]|nr:hypothetical protein FLA_0902 [Filimonas lacunae]
MGRYGLRRSTGICRQQVRFRKQGQTHRSQYAVLQKILSFHDILFKITGS